MKSLIEHLSENPLQVALVENEELREQLANANEEISSLQKSNDDMGTEFSNLERHYKYLAEKERDSANVFRSELEKANANLNELCESLEWSLGCHNFDKREMPEAYELWENCYSTLERIRKELAK